MARILAVDPGLHMGWALFEENKLLKSGTWHLRNTNASGCRGQAMETLELKLQDLIGDKTTDLVYEDVRRHLGTTAAHMYGSIVGILDKYCYSQYGTVPDTIPVKKAKKFASGKGNADKLEMIAAANRLYNLSLGPKDDNEADAICIGHTYIHDQVHTNAATPRPVPGPKSKPGTRVGKRSPRQPKNPKVLSDRC